MKTLGGGGGSKVIRCTASRTRPPRLMYEPTTTRWTATDAQRPINHHFGCLIRIPVRLLLMVDSLPRDG